MEKYVVKESRTGVILVSGTYEFCKNWVLNNCKYDKKTGSYIDLNREIITID